MIAKLLEIEALARRLHDGLSMAEFGCGNGITAIELARRFKVRIEGFDFSPEMIAEARRLAADAKVADRVCFEVADIRTQPVLAERFDVVYSERMIINLPDWKSQAEAIRTLAGYLKPGGQLLLCENSSVGHEALNALREAAGLPTIVPPWHNRYLDDGLVAALKIPEMRLAEVDAYSSIYYFLSRVVNAWLASREGKEPVYDAPVNQLALLLPAFGSCAQGKLWVWQRDTAEAATAVTGVPSGCVVRHDVSETRIE